MTWMPPLRGSTVPPKGRPLPPRNLCMSSCNSFFVLVCCSTARFKMVWPMLRSSPVHSVNWASLRRVRWREIYEPLGSYKINKELPKTLPKRVRRRVLLLGDIVHYEGGMMTIDTLTPHHEDVDKNGKPMLKAVAPARHRIVDPAEIEQIIEAIYKNPGLGVTRGVSTIFKLLSRSYLGISRVDVEQTLQRIAVYRSRIKPNAREI